MSLLSRLLNIPRVPQHLRMTPDSLYGEPDAQTFFYVFQSPLTGRPDLVLGGSRSHYETVKDPRYGPRIMPNDLWKTLRNDQGPRQEMMKYSLAGRLGTLNGKQYVIFWNVDNLQEHLKPALREMVRQKLVAPQAVVVTPVSADQTIADVCQGEFQQTHELTPAEKEELYKQIHLMPSDKKREAMKLLGLGDDGGVNPWTAALRKTQTGYNDYWRGTSEGFRAWLTKD